MNDLIWDLFKQSGIDIGEDQEDNVEKFAELIVTRCASIVSLYRRDNLEDKAVADTLEAAYREIKLTFGMKP